MIHLMAFDGGNILTVDSKESNRCIHFDGFDGPFEEFFS